MIMKLFQRLKAKIGKKNYSISRDLRESYNIGITTQGLDGYDKDTAKAMRFDVLCGMRQMAGVSWPELGKWLDDEFLRNNRRSP